MKNIQSADRLESLLRNGSSVSIIGHFNPDGDAVGAVTGLGHFLEKWNICHHLILPGHHAAYLDYLDRDCTILYYSDDREECDRIISGSDIIVCLDFNRLSRTEWMKEILSSAPAEKILIDHHPDPDRDTFSIVISDISVSSTCELLYWTFLSMPSISGDCSRLPKQTLLSLSTGLITDTNNFNNSTSAATFLMASHMMEAGIDLTAINDSVSKNFSEQRTRLMGKLIHQSMTLVCNRSASYIILTRKDKAEHDFRDGDTEGFVNIPLTISHIEVSAFFSECEGYVRVSLRSKGKISVNRLANRYFNGGGHEKAAGGRLFIPIQEVPEYFTRSLEEFMKEEHIG